MERDDGAILTFTDVANSIFTWKKDPNFYTEDNWADCQLYLPPVEGEEQIRRMGVYTADGEFLSCYCGEDSDTRYTNERLAVRLSREWPIANLRSVTLGCVVMSSTLTPYVYYRWSNDVSNEDPGLWMTYESPGVDIDNTQYERPLGLRWSDTDDDGVRDTLKLYAPSTDGACTEAWAYNDTWVYYGNATTYAVATNWLAIGPADNTFCFTKEQYTIDYILSHFDYNNGGTFTITK